MTISGGRLSHEIAKAFSVPPASPTNTATKPATVSGRCQSCQAAPITTAARLIIDPTERSMPPVMMMGVIASASSPSSTLKRTTSKKLLQVKKFSAITEKMAISTASASRRIHSPLGKKRSRQGLGATCGKIASMFFPTRPTRA